MRSYAHLTPVQVDTEIAKYDAEIAALEAKLSRAKRAREGYTEEFEARGGWTRAFLVNNADGHVHRHTHCSTCRWTTQFQWVTALSGSTEEEIIAAAGELVCTVCYPDAPVEVTSKPGTLRTDHQIAKEQRDAEKAKRDAEKAVKGITNPDGSQLVVGNERPSTERAARILLGQRVADVIWYRHDGTPHPDEPKWIADAVKLAEAIAHKTGEDKGDLIGEALAKGSKKTKREYRQAGIATDWVDGVISQISPLLHQL